MTPELEVITMEEGTSPESWRWGQLVLPGRRFEDAFRFHLTYEVWRYARERGVFPRDMRRMEVAATPGYRLVVDELLALCDWLPMPSGFEDQSEMIDAYLLMCRTPAADKLAGEEIATLSCKAFLASLEHPPGGRLCWWFCGVRASFASLHMRLRGRGVRRASLSPGGASFALLHMRLRGRL